MMIKFLGKFSLRIYMFLGIRTAIFVLLNKSRVSRAKSDKVGNVMRNFFQRNRLAIAMAALALWFTGLNLCAFAVLAGSDARSSGCPFCQGKDGPHAASPFCDKYKSQEATSSTPHETIRFSALSLPVVDFLPFKKIRLIKAPPLAGQDTAAPPGERCFAELVLQRSLFTQAPPAG